MKPLEAFIIVNKNVFVRNKTPCPMEKVLEQSSLKVVFMARSGRFQAVVSWKISCRIEDHHREERNRYEVLSSSHGGHYPLKEPMLAPMSKKNLPSFYA